MGMGDNGSFYRAPGINIKVSTSAEQTAGCRFYDVVHNANWISGNQAALNPFKA
jgi:hypothetical protein